MFVSGRLHEGGKHRFGIDEYDCSKHTLTVCFAHCPFCRLMLSSPWLYPSRMQSWRASSWQAVESPSFLATWPLCKPGLHWSCRTWPYQQLLPGGGSQHQQALQPHQEVQHPQQQQQQKRQHHQTTPLALLPQLR
jgi:hypothetical protein